MHTDTTVKLLETVTASFGEKLRAFSQKTCPAFNTRELRRESNARTRREARESAARGQANPQAGLGSRPKNLASSSSHPHFGPVQRPPSPTATSGHPINIPRASDEGMAGTAALRSDEHRPKSFNLNTYKVHALGDYAATIRRYGTTDSYSTEPVRNAHGYLVESHSRVCRAN
jgi:hypothetical protein